MMHPVMQVATPSAPQLDSSVTSVSELGEKVRVLVAEVRVAGAVAMAQVVVDRVTGAVKTVGEGMT